MHKSKLMALSKFGLALLSMAITLVVPKPAHAFSFWHYCLGEPSILETPTLPQLVNGCSIPTGTPQYDAMDMSILFWNWYSKKPVAIGGTRWVLDCFIYGGDNFNDVALANRSTIDNANGLTVYHHQNVCVGEPFEWGNYTEADLRVANDLTYTTLPPSSGWPRCVGCPGTGRGVFVHEMGHQLSLGHSNQFTTMNETTPQWPTSIWGPQPMPDDVAGLNSVYGAKALVDLAASGQRETVSNPFAPSNIFPNHDLPETVCQGDSFTIMVTTVNLGNTSKTFNHRAFISTSATGTNPAAAWAVSGTVASPGFQKQQAWSAIMPSTVPLGSYYLFHEIDHTGSISEFVEVNNKLRYTGQITVVDCPATMYTTGDFDNNGKTDVIITTPTGSYWYYSMGMGNWTVGYIRTDLPIGTVKYTPADFNGDAKTDLIITTPSGSYWYYSTGLSGGVGTWNPAYSASLPIGTVQFTTGDFDGNFKQDVIITTALGSELYYSTGTGTWSSTVYKNTALPLGTVSYTPGDFNGDTKSDVIITTALGSFWYFSTGLGTWNTTAYQRTDLPRGTVDYVVGDFNGDVRKDVIIITASGSYWYYSTGTGTWDNMVYNRGDLPRNSVAYTVGDFTNDGRSDLVITTATGSYWYYSTGTGTWSINQHNRTDLKLNQVMFTPADFTGDGKRDLIYTKSTGSTWYYASTQSTWTTGDQRPDLPL